MFSVKEREMAGDFTMDTEEKDMGRIAVGVATAGENRNIGKPIYYCKWNEFWKFVGIWIVTAVVLFVALLLITIVSGSNNIVQDTIREVDTLNMMFFLVLSALLEQIWSKNSQGGLYNFTLGAEGGLTIVGGMLFIAYSIVEQTDANNVLMQLSFELNVGYIIISIIVVLLGFFSRAIHEKI